MDKLPVEVEQHAEQTHQDAEQVSDLSQRAHVSNIVEPNVYGLFVAGLPHLFLEVFRDVLDFLKNTALHRLELEANRLRSVVSEIIVLNPAHRHQVLVILGIHILRVVLELLNDSDLIFRNLRLAAQHLVGVDHLEEHVLVLLRDRLQGHQLRALFHAIVNLARLVFLHVAVERCLVGGVVSPGDCQA